MTIFNSNAAYITVSNSEMVSWPIKWPKFQHLHKLYVENCVNEKDGNFEQFFLPVEHVEHTCPIEN